MKVINLNESQYKRLFEVISDTDPLIDLGNENPDPLPSSSQGEVRTGPVGSKPFGGITKGKETDGKLMGKDLGDVVSRTSTFNMGGVRGGTGGF